MVNSKYRSVNWVSVFTTVALLCQVVACSGGVNTDTEEELLRALHAQVLEAHRSGDVDAWMAVEGDPYVSANEGSITFPTAAERKAMREPYLRSTNFTSYRDLQPPIVRVSEDGTLGWVIAEVEIRGVQVVNGAETPVDAIWAWIELYHKRGGSWRLIGNVSNRRP